MRIKCLYKCSSEPRQCLIDFHDWRNLLWTSDILIKPMPFIVNFVCVHSSTLHNVAELYIVQTKILIIYLSCRLETLRLVYRKAMQHCSWNYSILSTCANAYLLYSSPTRTQWAKMYSYDLS
jgi:hypothetical protein